MSVMLTGSLLANLATTALAAFPNVFSALPTAKTISTWALGYVLVSIGFALLWVLAVSAGRYYQRRSVRMAAQLRFSEGNAGFARSSLREDWGREDQQLFMQFLEGAGKNAR